ncbi:MAG: uracil-DNA glycosylase [Burkholderiales bacterium]|nr:uracil-DNA glycosylase [Bacteroidia bacterium]
MIELISDNSWHTRLLVECNKPYFKDLEAFIQKERSAYPIYPEPKDIFNAFNLTPFNKVKVVVIGQDPYHGKNQAHGLSFSVNDGIKTPPSLMNIFKEMRTDLGFDIPNHGNLTAWAQQGILLLNATLTVRAGLPGSHQKKGWEIFTNEIIKTISEEKENCVFLLWGSFARSKKELINSEKHLVLEAAHPSPLARGAFFGCRHFSKTNDYLVSKNKTPIGWGMPNYNLFDQK